MRKRFAVIAGLVALTFMASTQVVQAQDHLVVTIPFDFMAGNSKMPAGDYTVKAATRTTSVLVISRVDANDSAFVPANTAVSANLQKESKLIFNCYDGRYFLSQVWMEGSSRGKELMKSAREKEMAQVARVDDRNQVVLVANLSK